MKFFLDCNISCHHQAAFEGFKESTVFLNVKAFVELREGRSSLRVGLRYVGLGGVEV